MKKYLIPILLVGVGFSQTQEWIYFNHVPMDCAYWWCFPTGVETINRIKPNGEGNEIILEDAIFTDISQDQTKLLLIDSNLHVYNRETMDSISIIFENFDIHQAQFTNDENLILFSGGGDTGNELYSYSIFENSITLLGDSLSNHFNNLEISPDGQKVLYFRESQVQPEGVSGCDLPENTLYLTELDGGTGSYIGEVFYHSTADIGEFQFGIMGPPTGSSATGGDAEDAGFTIEYPSGNSVLGLSTGLAIPAGCGTLTNISRNNNAGGLNNIIILDSNGDTLDFTYYDGYLNTDDYSRNVDVIIEDIESGDTTILATISQLIISGGNTYGSLIYNQPYWSDNGFIYLFFLDNSECMQLFKIHSTNGSITQLTDNPCSGYNHSSILETNESDLERFVYTVFNDSLLHDEYWIYDTGSNEFSYLGYFGNDNHGSRPMSQTWSPDRSKVAFNEMLLFGFPFSGPLRVYDTVTDSIIILEQYNGWSNSLASSRIVWVEDSIEYNGPVWHVATSGSDSTGSGSINSPFATIQKAVNNASHGDTVLVSPGLYCGSVDFIGKNIVVGSHFLIDSNDVHIDSTILGPGDPYDYSSDCGYYFGGVNFVSGEDSTAQFIGFTISGTWGSPSIKCIGSNPSISYLNIENNTVTSQGVLEIIDSHPSLDYLNLLNNKKSSSGHMGGNNGAAMSINNSNVSLSNSLIVNNISIYEDNFYGTTDTLGGGIIVVNNSILMQNNNTFFGNSGSTDYASAIHIYDSSSSTIKNSIFWNDSVHEQIIGSANITYSNVYGGWDGEGNINMDPLFCNPDSNDFTLAENSPCVGTGQNNTNMGALGIGCEAFLSTKNDIVPLQYILYQNYPNPFNPVTSLRYDLPEDGLVNITIYDMMGRVVKTLINSSQTAGYKFISWNATNDRNEPVSAGLYLYTIQAGEFRQTKKMVLLK